MGMIHRRAIPFIYLTLLLGFVWACEGPYPVRDFIKEDKTDIPDDYKKVNRSVWAYGKHPFQNPGQPGWIVELEGNFAITPLKAGKDKIGNLKMIRRDGQLDVRYSLGPGALVGNLHLWAGCSPDDIPKADKSGRVAPYKFPYSHKKPISSKLFEIDLGSLNCPGNYFVAAYARKFFKDQDIAPSVAVQELDFPDNPPDEYVDEVYTKAINDHGEIVGNQWIVLCLDEPCGAILFIHEALKWTTDGEVKWLGLIDIEGFGPTPANDINNYGKIAGFELGEGAIIKEFPVPLGESGIRPLGADPFNSNALAINDLDHAVGYSETSQGRLQAFLWNSENGITDLGALPGHKESRATAINNLGQVIGWSQSSSGDLLAKDMPEPGINDLSSEQINTIHNYRERIMGGNQISNNTRPYHITKDVSARGINNPRPELINSIRDYRQEVNELNENSSNERQYFLWDKVNGLRDLGSEQARSINDYGKISSALAINNHGQTIKDGNLYDPEIGVIELKVPGGATRCETTDLNDQGQIAGTCFGFSDVPRNRAVKWIVTY